MAALSAQDREALFGKYASDISLRRLPTGLTKAELRAAINAIDDWADANQTSFNTSIPQPARAALSAKEKAMLLMYVIARRWEVSV